MSNQSRIANWISIGANVAVFVGLVLLVFELQQNRDLTKAQIRDELSDGIFDLLMYTADNPQLADLMVRADSGQELTPAEHFQYASRTRAMYRYFENVHYQYRNGLYETSEFERQTIAWKNYLNRSKAAVDIWCSYQHSVSEDFANTLNGLLTENTCGK